MTDILFSFDTEDFTSNHSADAICREAKILQEAGVKGCFVLVGLVAKQLVEWGREDVLEALSHHEIGLHSYGHSFHPTINEYTDLEDFDAAREEFLRQEQEGIRLIEEATGRRDIFNSACPPGNQSSYVALYGYSELGVPTYVGSPADTADGGGAYYCNMYHITYPYAMEEFLFGDEDDIRKVLDDAAGRKRAIIYTHPHMSLFKEHWDAYNYRGGNRYPFGQWQEPPRWSEEMSERFYANMKKMVEMIKADSRFRIISCSEMNRELAAAEPRVIRRDMLPLLQKQLEEAFYPVTLPQSFCLSDMFLACRDFLLGKNEHTCGRVYGFLGQPYAVETPVTVSAEELRKSAAQIKASRFLPERITVGTEEIGPGDWLRAALAVLNGADTVTVKPAEAMPSLAKLPEIQNLSYRAPWTWMQCDSFTDTYLSDRMRLQSWTMRFPKGSCRM